MPDQKILIAPDRWDRTIRYSDSHLVRALGNVESKEAEQESLVRWFDLAVVFVSYCVCVVTPRFVSCGRAGLSEVVGDIGRQVLRQIVYSAEGYHHYLPYAVEFTDFRFRCRKCFHCARPPLVSFVIVGNAADRFL